MLTKVRKTLETHRMLRPGDHVLAAVSGGADSVALLAVLQRLAPACGVTLTAAHFNHGMRASESDRDEDFVRRLCRARGIPLLTGSIGAARRTKGLSPEDFLRRRRYAFLEAAGRRAGADRIALGHHRGDQAETVLMHLIRGCGVSGLAGIPPVRDGGRFIRPLIDCSPGEIALFLEGEGLSFVTDSSNADERFLRNRVRRTLLPELQGRFNPAILDALCRLADIVRQEDDYMRGRALRALASWPGDAEGATIPVRGLARLHPALKRRVVLEALRRLAGPDRAVGLEHVEAVLDLAEGPGRCGSLDLPGNVLVRRSGGTLECRRGGRSERRGRVPGPPEGPGELFCLEVPVPGTIRIESLGLGMRFRVLRRPPSVPSATARRAYLDLDRIDGTLVVRSPRAGDRIQPLGMPGTRKLSRLFIDEKVPRADRGRIPVLADDRSVLWVPGIRLSERARVAEGTRHVLKAEII
ncbi:MAG TPA: tRNA lysidine(34) synthetase TilS [Syntrophales bacterium]|nr:tRNA lysidine(34) synthetase TilS [Syntrophales bacterium]